MATTGQLTELAIRIKEICPIEQSLHDTEVGLILPSNVSGWHMTVLKTEVVHACRLCFFFLTN